MITQTNLYRKHAIQLSGKISGITLNILLRLQFFRSKFWYAYVYKKLHDTPVRFVNYGYENLANEPVLSLKAVDEKDRLFINLYHAVISSVELTGLDVLEVGCGRGGGASYIARYHRPKSLVGVDIVNGVITFCNNAYKGKDLSLSFYKSNAEKLTSIANNSFDVVVNVESSHCYRNIDKFMNEVMRVLRPGGYLLLADFRRNTEISYFHQHLTENGFEIIENKSITKQIKKAIEVDSKRRIHLIKTILPDVLNEIGRQFIGVEGSRIYEAFKSENIVYERFVCQKMYYKK